MPKTKNKKRIYKKKAKQFISKPLVLGLALLVIVLIVLAAIWLLQPYDINTYRAKPFLNVTPFARPAVSASGLNPANVRKAYNLPTGNVGTGTIAIIDAFDNPKAEADLGIFNTQYGLRACTTQNGCFEKHKMANNIATAQDWAMESSLDVQWAHAIAPGAKILLVEATDNSGNALINAINYARFRSDVVAISMSWGGGEFSSEGSYEGFFVSPYGATFFASSGDSGHGVSWPAVSANVVSVGGTRLNQNSNGAVVSETAWAGSGGGISAYLNMPSYQTQYKITGGTNKRAVPDVSYDADPATGFSVYDSFGYGGRSGWFIVGGTSAGAPQWAAIKAIGRSVTLPKLYTDARKSNYASYLRDITTGTNGGCGTQCTARAGYDFVTGLGSPLTQSF